MADLIADIKLRWYDDSCLIEDDPRMLLEVFLDSIGVTSDVARDLVEVMFMAKANDVSLTTRQVKDGIIEIRRRRKPKDREFGMTDRNIQIWLKYFEQIGLFDCIGGRHRFSSNKKPSEAFKKTRQVVSESVKFSQKALEKAEEAYLVK